ncbi:MAG: hypothetical protein R2771_11440 [Saprospiraceae bacterium]
MGNSEYFGIINVGDETTLYKLAVENGVLGDEKEFSASEFKKINEENSTINLLIGSKKFTEGWSSWRVSSMGLMNVGKSEGSQIIQLFGRGVRLKGYNFSLKRSEGLDDYQKPDNIKQVRKYLKPLETLQIFGVQANYMEQFKAFLEEEGLPSNDSTWISIKIPTKQKEVVKEQKLKLIRVVESEQYKKEIISLSLDLTIFSNNMVDVDWYPKIEVLEITKTNTVTNKNEAKISQNHLAFLDWNKVYLSIEKYKADKAFYNLSITKEILQEIIANNTWYHLFIPEQEMLFDSFGKVKFWEEIVTTLLKKYVEKFNLFYKNQYASEHIESTILNPEDDNFVLEYDVRLNTESDIKGLKEKVEQLEKEVLEPTFKKIQIATEIQAFDHILHLYKPLIYVGKGYENSFLASPVALDASEKQFLDDLLKYVKVNATELSDTEIHVLRNQSKKGLGFFTEGNNFYPDFIVWVLKGDKQYIKFVDPKGIRNSKGINDPKIQLHKVLKEKIQPQVADSNIELDSFIVSNTSFLEVQWKDQLEKSDFNKNNVYFQKENADVYVKEIVKI